MPFRTRKDKKRREEIFFPPERRKHIAKTSREKAFEEHAPSTKRTDYGQRIYTPVIVSEKRTRFIKPPTVEQMEEEALKFRVANAPDAESKAEAEKKLKEFRDRTK